VRVAVAGAGVAGSIAALEAIARGWDVTMFDDPDAPRCSATAAGMLSPYAELETADRSLFDLGMRSLDRWPAVLERLPGSVFFRREGSLLTAHRADLPLLHHLIGLIERKVGRPVARLTHDELQRLEPGLSHQHEAAWLPDEGQIDAQGFVEAAQASLAGSCDIRNTRVAAVRPGEVTLANGSSETFDWVIDCRGLGARPDAPELRGVRGEILWVHAPEVSIRRPIRLMHPRYRVYVVPRPDHIYLVGATEIEAEDRSPISVRSTLELLSALYALQPAFAEARIVRTDVSLRPAFPDNRPRAEHVDGLTRINGLFRHGYLIAPALVGDAVAFVASRSESEVPLHAVH